LDVFLHAEIGNTTELNLANFEDLYSGIIKNRASAGLWFYAASVGIHPSCIVVLLTSLIQIGIGYPRYGVNITDNTAASR
jgi:hypothetical protein